MTEIPPYLFIVTSTALVLGVAITLRGLWGFRPLATDAATDLASDADAGISAATAASTSEMSTATDPSTGTAQTDVAPGATSAYQVRDLREPLIMTIAGIFICLFTVLGIAALVNSA